MADSDSSAVEQTCPACGAAAGCCESADCPKQVATAALCQECGQEECNEKCPVRIANHIRTAAKATPFRLGV